MKASKTTIIGIVLMLIPAMSMGALAQEQEQGIEAVEIGQWKSARLIGVVFEANNQTYNTTNSTFYFTIADARNSLSAIPSGMLYQTAVYTVEIANNTTKAVQLQPDGNGTYTLEMKEPGNYTIGILSAPQFSIPLCGNFITPAYQSQITVVREKSGWQIGGPIIPTNLLWPVIFGTIIASIVLYIVLKVIREKEEQDGEEESEEEEEPEEQEEEKE